MTPPSHTAKGLMIIAVESERERSTTVRSGYAVAHQFGMEMRLVSVVEPVPFDLVAFDSPAYLAYPPINAEVEARRVTERTLGINALCASLGSELAVSSRVMSGAVVPSLISEAVSHRANLIVCGYDGAAYRQGVGGFSSTLALMHDAPLPVIAVPSDRALHAGKSGFRILLADDLAEGTREAARKAYELAARLPGSQLRHVHVYADMRHALRDTWNDLVHRTQSLASDRIESAEQFLIVEAEARKARLAVHGDPFVVAAEKAGVEIQLDVRSGKVESELSAAIDEFNPDLIVFGRHRLLHVRPFLIGRMPFKAMLHAGRSILMVPPRSELYQALPFPAAPA